MTNAHLVKLSGMGDHQWYLLDDTAWNYLSACCDVPHGGEAPEIPDAVIERYIDENPGQTRETAVEHLTLNTSVGDADNDLALCMPPSLFGGEKFSIFHASVSELSAFVAKHNLTLHEPYDGYIY